MERRAYVLAALAFASITALGSCGRARVAMRNLFGQEPADEVRFSHQSHLVRGSSCLQCHANLDQPGNARPGHDACAGSCHDVEAKDQCSLCHSDPERARKTAAPDRGLIFQHTKHQQSASGNCMRCHEAVATAQATVEMPSMDSCADGCHKEDFTELRCDRCHLDLTRYPLQAIKTWSHTREFERRHGPAAKSDASTCTTCHDASYCSDCHADNNSAVALDARRIDQATRGFIHPSPYEAVHAIDAASRKDSCDTCHRPSFCTSCHALRGVAGIEEATSRHPDGWLDPSSMSFHGTEARRSIASCAGCHDRGEQSVCVRCHQVGGTGGNPHPHMFSRRDLPKDNRMCRTCHVN